MIGPIFCKTPKVKKELLALALMDHATRWFEVKDMKVQSSRSVMAVLFDDLWISRSPRPEFICYDNGK
jgi:hypothetical protein